LRIGSISFNMVP